MAPNHALVFGASGLCGWAVVDQLLSNYPSRGTFSKVTALINRPFSVADSYWPDASPSPSQSRPELDLVSNMDLTQGSVEDFTEMLKGKVEDIGGVTHAFYFAYKQDGDADQEVKTNRAMFNRAIGALNALSPNLKFVVFPSGTKGYGIHIPGGFFKAPLKESMGRLPPPAGDTVHYYAFEDILTEASKGKAWTWCEVLPDAIIGFTPNGSTFSLPAHWATYLSTYALIHGKGVKIPFPGTSLAYTSLFNDVSADTIARFSIWASLHPEITGGGQVFNIADQAKPESMQDRWPKLAGWFGLEGVAPLDVEDTNDSHPPLKPGEFIEKHRDILDRHCQKSNQVFGAQFLDAYGYHFTFDRQLSMDKTRSAGFSEEIDPNSSWFKAFERFRKAGLIPS